MTLTWGNGSGFGPASQLAVIKRSGVDYASLRPADMGIYRRGRRGALSMDISSSGPLPAWSHGGPPPF